MSKYDIDFTELTRQLLPVELRKKKMRAWLKALNKPVVLLYDLFLKFKSEILYELDHNGQVCRLRKVLNDKFDNVDRRIYIEDAPVKLPLYIHRRIEDKPVYIRRRSEATPVYIYRRSEITFGGTFIVFVPATLDFDIDEMKLLINKYRLAGKAYTIKTF